MQKFLKKVFYNEEKPLLSWVTATLALIVLYPLYLYFLLFLSFYSPTQAGGTMFILGASIGIILLPSIALIDFKAKANNFIVTLWVFIVAIAIIITAALYSKYQQKNQEEFAQKNIPVYENATLQEIKYSPGNGIDSPSTTSVFALENSDSKLMDIVDFYNQEFASKGWIQDNRQGEEHDEAYWKSQPGYKFTGENWFLKVGSGSTDYYEASIQKSEVKNNEYSIHITFYGCNDAICKFEKRVLLSIPIF